jgi:hypothetical protein
VLKGEIKALATKIFFEALARLGYGQENCHT